MTWGVLCWVGEEFWLVKCIQDKDLCGCCFVKKGKEHPICQMINFPPNLCVGALPAGAPEKRNQALSLTKPSDPVFLWKADLKSRFRLLKYHCHHGGMSPWLQNLADCCTTTYDVLLCSVGVFCDMISVWSWNNCGAFITIMALRVAHCLILLSRLKSLGAQFWPLGNLFYFKALWERFEGGCVGRQGIWVPFAVFVLAEAVVVALWFPLAVQTEGWFRRKQENWFSNHMPTFYHQLNQVTPNNKTFSQLNVAHRKQTSPSPFLFACV